MNPHRLMQVGGDYLPAGELFRMLNRWLWHIDIINYRVFFSRSALGYPFTHGICSVQIKID